MQTIPGQREFVFDQPPAQQHSATSVAAAESVREVTGELRISVYRFIHSCGDEGCSDEQIIDHFGKNPSSIRPRRIELVQANWIKDSGRTRPTRSGRQATIWIVV